MRQYAEYADRLIQHLGVDEAYFLGHSHGGFVALQLALDHPEHLEGVIVYDSMAFSGQELHELVVFPESGHFAHLEEPEAFQQAVVKFTTR